MTRLSGVTIEGEASARKRARSSLAVRPSIIFSAMTRETFASRRTDSSRLAAMTGMPTLSSNAPFVDDRDTVVSLPMTCADAWIAASQMTGLTLPGMIEEPGCRSGMAISPSPVLGPEPIQRRSLLIFMKPYAIVRSWPETSTSPSRLAWASKWLRASVMGRPVCCASSSTTRAENPAGVLMPVPTAVPPWGTSATRGREASMRSMP